MSDEKNSTPFGAIERDTIADLHGASVQHGPLNQRVYLMSLNDADVNLLVVSLDELAKEKGYTKIFAKVNQARVTPFLSAGYQQEAVVPGYFNGTENAIFLGKYFSSSRQIEPNRPTLDEIVQKSQLPVTGKSNSPFAHDGIIIRSCTPDDVTAMGALYRQVFQSYPFPIESPDYLLSTMKTHVMYFCVEHHGEIVALSSAEMDKKNGAVEMTDFATHSKWRGRGAAGVLLAQMEAEMRSLKMRVLYTIARANSQAVNRLFGAAGYAFGGLLVNNTHIGGQIESMTVWYKSLM